MTTVTTIDALAREIAAKDAEIARLREALEFYADENEWDKYSGKSHWALLFNSTELDANGWEKAREALAGGKP